MQKLWYVCVVISLLMSCSSRKSQQPPVGAYYLQQHPSAQAPMQHTERLIALDRSTVDALFYVNHTQGRLPSGHVAIQVNLQNKSAEHDLWVEWKVVFYDAQNFQLEETEWTLTHFPAKEVVTLKANSMRQDVMNFTIMLRTPFTEDGKDYRIQKEDVQ
jgi:uncharacterized protein YcfL